VFFKRKSESVWAQEGEVAAEAAAPAPKEKLGWFEKRARRRRRRIVFEEVLGWILVPAFLYLLYLGYRAVGGIPKEAIDFFQELIGLAMKSV
jgi:Fe2+ transport system protein B